MMKNLAVTLAIVIAMSLVASCGSPAPAVTPEPKIPPHFTTYTSEGLFSISYPPDWVSAQSHEEDLLQKVQEMMKGLTVLFVGGIPSEEGYYPSVSIIVAPRSTGYWKLDEIVEAQSKYDRENLQGYREYFQVRTSVDGREAIIRNMEAYEPEFGTWRSLQLFMPKDNFVWVVTCSIETEDFKDYEAAFYSIVRSLRILN